ncbi:hypothetical protein [Paenibacillus sp. RC67]|uniref:hypothetical protein n=1 Tax=Paenibacillus sp. RC67 TaxID=3039392 RepID=UPI0024ADDF37|nr:hypothetical protein [Paenibacillus sp. RC67]
MGHKTLYTYNSNFNTRIPPYFQQRRMEEIKALHIVNFLDLLKEEGSRGDKKVKGLATGTNVFQHRIKKIINRAV